MTPTPSVLAAFTPTDKLRASINLGNPILAYTDVDGDAQGVSEDIAGEFARLLGVGLELVVVDAAGKSVDVVASEQVDIGFFAIDAVPRCEHCLQRGVCTDLGMLSREGGFANPD